MSYLKRYFCRACSTGAIARFKSSLLLNVGGVLEVLSDTSQLLEAQPAWHGFPRNSHCSGSSWGPAHHLPRAGTSLEVLTHLTAHRGGFFGCRPPGKAKAPPLQARGPHCVCLSTISAVNRTLSSPASQNHRNPCESKSDLQMLLWSCNHSGFKSIILLR